MKSLMKQDWDLIGDRILSRQIEPEGVRKGTTIAAARIVVELFQRNQKVREIVVVPEVAHSADRFLNVCDRLFIRKWPLISDRQYGRLRANPKVMYSEHPRCKNGMLDRAPAAGIGLAALVRVGTETETGR